MTRKTPQWVPKLLDQITSQDFQELILTLLIQRNNDLECFSWAEVAKALLGQQFTRLKQVRIRLQSADSDQIDRVTTARVIREQKLPTFNDRGILRIEFLD